MKRRFIRKITALSLAAITLLLVGCGTTTESKDNACDTKLSEDIPGWKRYATEEPVIFDWYINYSWFVTGWGNNLVSKKITEDTGVSVNFIVPKGNAEQKLNSLISTDSLPDLITLEWWDMGINEMISKDMVYALNELADQYDPYFYKIADGTVVDWYTANDGNIYSYPSSSTTPQDMENNKNIASNQTFLVRKDIYEAIGSPDMSTVEGFSDAVRKAVEMFPEVNGEPLIPIGAHEFDEIGCPSFDKYLMNYLAIPYETDGKFYERFTDEEYLKWLKAFRQLGEEGYLADCIFVDNRTQMSEKIERGQYFCMMYQRTDLADQQKVLYKSNPDSIYMAIEGPRNSNGDDPKLPVNTINGWTVTLISKNCKHPDRAIAFMNYLISDYGQKITSIGIEGETYDIIDGKYVLKPEVETLLYADRKAYDATYGSDNAYWMLQDNVMQSQWMPPSKEPVHQMEEWTYKYAAYTGQYEIYVKEESQVGFAKDRIEKLWSKTLPQLLLAKDDAEFDAIVEDFKAQREELGYEMLLKEETRQIIENKRRLGLE